MPVFAGYGAPLLGSPAYDFDVDIQPALYTISGVTRDAVGVPLGGCTVSIYETVSGILRTVVTSDAAGNYVAGVPGVAGLTFFAVMYKAGAPDVSGTTPNTLTAVPA